MSFQCFCQYQCLYFFLFFHKLISSWLNRLHMLLVYMYIDTTFSHVNFLLTRDKNVMWLIRERKYKYSGTSLIQSSKMRTPPSTGHHQESSCFCFVCFCQINLGGASGLARAWRLSHYSVLHYIVFVSIASTTRRKQSVLTLEKKLEIIGVKERQVSEVCIQIV